jgi:hypothetical protein
MSTGSSCRAPRSRPARKLGYLPGDMKDKVDPYMQPLYDALNDFLPGKQVAKLIEEKRIEIAPLAFMRGRTLSNAFVVLDEAQNATSMQMKMFLTRLGEGSRMVITGDRSQVDLPRGVFLGPARCRALLKGIDAGSRSTTSPPRTWCAIRWWHTDRRPGLGRRLISKTIAMDAWTATLEDVGLEPTQLSRSVFWPVATRASPRSMRISAASRRPRMCCPGPPRTAGPPRPERCRICLRPNPGRPARTSLAISRWRYGTCAREAAETGTKFERSRRAICSVHGLLHLLGFDHETDADADAEWKDLRHASLQDWGSLTHIDVNGCSGPGCYVFGKER